MKTKEWGKEHRRLAKYEISRNDGFIVQCQEGNELCWALVSKDNVVKLLKEAKSNNNIVLIKEFSKLVKYYEKEIEKFEKVDQ